MENVYVVGLHKRELKLGKGDIRKSGDPVPEAMLWKANVLQSHLSLKWIMLKDEYEHLKKAEEARIKQRRQEKEERELAIKHAEANRKAMEEHPVPLSHPGPEIDKLLAPEKNDELTEDVNAMSRSELQKKCKELKLSTIGNSATLKKRLRGASK